MFCRKIGGPITRWAYKREGLHITGIFRYIENGSQNIREKIEVCRYHRKTRHQETEHFEKGQQILPHPVTNTRELADRVFKQNKYFPIFEQTLGVSAPFRFTVFTKVQKCRLWSCPFGEFVSGFYRRKTKEFKCHSSRTTKGKRTNVPFDKAIVQKLISKKIAKRCLKL